MFELKNESSVTGFFITIKFEYKQVPLEYKYVTGQAKRDWVVEMIR